MLLFLLITMEESPTHVGYCKRNVLLAKGFTCTTRRFLGGGSPSCFYQNGAGNGREIVALSGVWPGRPHGGEKFGPVVSDCLTFGCKGVSISVGVL